MDIITQLARELNLRQSQVQATVDLIDQGNTIPFIARYRKEVTGSLDDAVLRDLDDRLGYLRNLEKRKEEVFGQEYDAFVSTLTRTINQSLWDSISFSVNEEVTTCDFFDIYNQYFS